jgi:hypothetical protein
MKHLTVLALCLICSLNSLGTTSDIEVVLHGKILNAKTQSPVEASVDIFYNSDFLELYPEFVAKGEFTVPLTGFGIYFITISAPGFIGASDTLMLMSDKKKVINKSYDLAPIEVGLTVTLGNIYFHFGQAELTTASFPELDKTAEFFRANPNAHFEIAGHTDRSGPPEYNLKLSQDRAQAVVNYLIAHGVSPSQLVAQGYGATKPVRTEHTREAEASNRRVEFTVLRVAALAEK